MRIRLTDKGLRALTAPPGKHREFWDTTFHHPGASFGVRVSGTTGSRMFSMMYRKDGVEKRLTLGPYPLLGLADAREKAYRIAGDVVVNDADPVAERKARAAAPTFRELAALYIERHAKHHKRRWQEDDRQIEKDLIPTWGDRKADEIRRADVMELLDAIMDRGAPIQANRTKALISKIFNFGLDRGLVESNPALRIPRPGQEHSRQRVLKADEIKKLWKSFNTLSSPLMGAHFKLRLLTAQRGLEILSMRWEDMDGEWWTIPASVSKNGLAHRVPLSPQARKVLESIRELSQGSPWVFPNGRGGHIEWVRHAVLEIREDSGISDWTPHDARRTASTLMTSMGIPRLVVSKLLNHAESGVTAVYDRASYDSEKRQALIAWGARVEEIVGGKQAAAKVVGRIG